MSLRRKLSEIHSDYGFILAAVLWWGSVFCAGYVIAGAVKDWAKTHVIFIQKVCATDSECEGI